MSRTKESLLGFELERCILHAGLSRCGNSSRIRKIASKTVFPVLASWMKLCHMMVLTNMAEPEWISGSCDEKWLHLVVCVRENRRASSSQVTSHLCVGQAIVFRGDCYNLKWLIKEEENECNNIGQKPDILHAFINAVQVPLPPFLFPGKDKTYVNVFVHTTDNSVIKQKKRVVPLSEAEGFLLCKTFPARTAITGNMYACKGSGFISDMYVCDGVQDCPNDDSDESDCSWKLTRGHHRNRSCPSLYHTAANGLCQKYMSLSMTNKKQAFESISLFYCKYGFQINAKFKDDLVADCSEAEDEPILMSVLHNHEFHTCLKPYELPCRLGLSTCYNFTAICIYRVSILKVLIPCRTGEHLKSCKHFECNMMMKCLNSYCLPWPHVCDGKWDCPFGYDEAQQQCRSTCIGMFKCKHASKDCIPLHDVCNNEIDCPLKDDELLCELNLQCPPHCQCLLFAIACEHAMLQPTRRSSFPHFLAVQVVHSNFHRHHLVLKMFSKALILQLKHNGLKSVCGLFHAGDLLSLNLENNSLTSIESNCFSGTKRLKSLSLNNNNITLIHNGSFAKLSCLQVLNLSSNPLTEIPFGTLHWNPKLKFLSLRNVQFHLIHHEIFEGTFLEFLETEDFHICCVASHDVHCSTAEPWYEPCSNLLPSSRIKMLCMIIFLLLCLFIGYSLFLHSSEKLRVVLNKQFRITVSCVCANEILCALVIGLIWTNHFIWEGTLAQMEKKWRSSFACFSIFGLTFLHSLSSPCLLLLFSLSRLMVVLSPLDTRFKETKFVRNTVTCTVAVSSSLALFVNFLAFFLDGIVAVPLCIPFSGVSNSATTVAMTWLTVITQNVSCIAIIVMHGIMLRSVLASQQSMPTSKSSDSNTALFVQVAFMTFSSILCYLPAGVFYLTVMFISQYPIDLLRWLVVCVLPLNSLTYPSCLSVTALRKHLKHQKMLRDKEFAGGPRGNSQRSRGESQISWGISQRSWGSSQTVPRILV